MACVSPTKDKSFKVARQFSDYRTSWTNTKKEWVRYPTLRTEANIVAHSSEDKPGEKLRRENYGQETESGI